MTFADVHAFATKLPGVTVATCDPSIQVDLLSPASQRHQRIAE